MINIEVQQKKDNYLADFESRNFDLLFGSHQIFGFA